jgi:hypothetical protein
MKNKLIVLLRKRMEILQPVVAGRNCYTQEAQKLEVHHHSDLLLLKTLPL